MWLEVDTIIRQKTKGKKSLDDFCRAFFGGESGPPTVKPYTFEEVVAALNDVVEYDWKALLLRRVGTTSEAPPQEGIINGGWRLTHGDKPTNLHRVFMSQGKSIDVTSSLGLALRQDGTISDIIPGKPAAKAGAGPGMKIIAINGRRFSANHLQSAIAATKTSGKVELLLENGDFFRTHTVEYRGGPRYPRLERIADKTDLLTPILAPRK